MFIVSLQKSVLNNVSTWQYVVCFVHNLLFYVIDFTLRSINCYNKSAIASTYGGCPSNTNLWRVVSPGYAEYLRKSAMKRFILTASCDESSTNLRVIQQVWICLSLTLCCIFMTELVYNVGKMLFHGRSNISICFYS